MKSMTCFNQKWRSWPIWLEENEGAEKEGRAEAAALDSTGALSGVVTGSSERLRLPRARVFGVCFDWLLVHLFHPADCCRRQRPYQRHQKNAARDCAQSGERGAKFSKSRIVFVSHHVKNVTEPRATNRAGHGDRHRVAAAPSRLSQLLAWSRRDGSNWPHGPMGLPLVV